MVVENSKKTYSYNGNPLLKRTNVKQEWTKDQIAEYIKCKNDPIYFIEKYMRIVHVDRGVIPFTMRDYQERIVKSIHENRFTILMASRQVGKSTCVAGFILHYIIFNQNKTVAILANKEKTSAEILSRIQFAYQYLPKFIQQGVSEFNKGSFLLENGSRVLAASTSSDSIRGFSISMLFCDEVAAIPSNTWSEFYKSTYPTISSGKKTKVVLVSTPAGYNHFYRLWNDAENGRNKFVPLKVDWTQVPERDEKWKEEEIANTSPETFAQEHDLDFMGSSNTLIATWKLREMSHKPPIFEKDGVKIYHRPKKEGVYVAICDVAEGNGGDSSTICIIDISGDCYRIAATYASNEISTILFPDVINKLATEYNEAYVLIEINSMGGEVANVIHNEFEYENILMTTSSGRKGQTISTGFGSPKLGIKTTKTTRRVGCSTLKSLIEENKLVIESLDIISELTAFVLHHGKYQAESGYNDDLVMCLVLFGWLTRQSYFTEMMDINLRQEMYAEKIKKIEDDLLPFGFYDDGSGINSDYPPGFGSAGWQAI